MRISDWSSDVCSSDLRNTSMKSLLCALGAALMALSAATGVANASVVIAGTRVVFPAANGEVTVRLNNNGEQPALVEAWIDNGAPASTPDTAHVPFLNTPPLVDRKSTRLNSSH